MMQARLKAGKKYVFCRVYCLIAVVAWNFFGIFGASKTPPYVMVFLMPVFMVIIVPAIFMVINWGVFPWQYSTFGQYERTSLPQGPPIFENGGSWGKIALVHASMPFFTWSVYPSGLGISILGIGKVFLPIEQITELKSGFLGCKLRHTSPELRNPVTLPKKVFEAVLELKTRGNAKSIHLNSGDTNT